MSANCVVRIVLDDAPEIKVRVQETPIVVKLVPDKIKVINVLEGPMGPAGVDGTPGATGPAGAPGTSRTTKSGVVAGASFSGTPKKFAVAFLTAYPDSTYTIAISGTDGRTYTYEAKTAAGFTINANANAVIAGEVSWTTMVGGETG